jgi:putative DNA primase/helicase
MQLRALGGSGLAKVDNTFVVFATGNNLEISADQVRRTIRNRMDANVKNPEQRRFERSPLNEARKDRGKYIAAVLTIARAYVCAGCPDLKLYASYETWSRLVRSPLMWLGEADPMETVAGIRTEDTKHAARAAVFWAWPADGQEYTTPALIETATQNADPALRDALFAIARGSDNEISPVRLGRWLAKQAAVISSGRKLIRGQTARGFVTWKMVGNGPARPPF